MEPIDNRSQAVKNLQRYLRFLSYHNPICKPPVDGIFAEDTEKAVSDFQRLMGIEETGRVNEELFELIYLEYQKSKLQNQPPVPMNVFPNYPQSSVYQKGSSGFPVSAIQFMLRELEVNCGSSCLPEMTGIFDDSTENAVTEFQKRCGLPCDGRVSFATWNRLTGEYNRLFSSYPQQ